MKSQSKDYPQIQKLQGVMLVPYNVRQIQIEMEEGELPEDWYEYQVYKHPIGPDKSNLSHWQQVVWRLLQQDLHAHVYGTYDQGEQATISAYGARALSQDRQDIVAECVVVQDWIDDVLGYYDVRKSQIFAATTEAELTGVTWDFPGDKPCTDRKDWRDIKGMFDA